VFEDAPGLNMSWYFEHFSQSLKKNPTSKQKRGKGKGRTLSSNVNILMLIFVRSPYLGECIISGRDCHLITVFMGSGKYFYLI
jgi:hypothetical protein